jgi:putative restriction endonuclease
MKLTSANDLFLLHPGDRVARTNLYQLIQYSKVLESAYWHGEEARVGNTPQQGINWIGSLPACRAVLVKTTNESYVRDGWTDVLRNSYDYSLKARSGKVNRTEKANSVLIQQPQYGYPVLLFSEDGTDWVFEGRFKVTGVEARHVRLSRATEAQHNLAILQEEMIYPGGGKHYLNHLRAEATPVVNTVAKRFRAKACDICSTQFMSHYGFDHIEAHYKGVGMPAESTAQLGIEDFAAICPNCHRAVHILMKREDSGYDALRLKLQSCFKHGKEITTTG